MAKGVEPLPAHKLKHGNARRNRHKWANLTKKIAVQFNPEQFAQINTVADSMGISFAAAVRHLIFKAGPLANPGPIEDANKRRPTG